MPSSGLPSWQESLITSKQTQRRMSEKLEKQGKDGKEHEACLYEGLKQMSKGRLDTSKLNQVHFYQDETAKVRKQMSKGRLDDQRGLEINSELPDFLKKPSSRISENEILSNESLKLYEEQRAKEEAREVKLRYLNSFTGNSYPNYSDRQKLERLGADPHFDVFFKNSSRQFHLQKNKWRNN